MKRFTCLPLFVLFISVTNIAHCQIRSADLHQRTLHLKQAYTFLFVVNENRIDQDSALFLVSRQTGLSRFYVIGEKMEDIWEETNNADLTYFKTQLAICKGVKHARLLNMIGSLYIFQPGSRKSDLDSAFLFLKGRTGSPCN